MRRAGLFESSFGGAGDAVRFWNGMRAIHGDIFSSYIPMQTIENKYFSYALLRCHPFLNPGEKLQCQQEDGVAISYV